MLRGRLMRGYKTGVSRSTTTVHFITASPTSTDMAIKYFTIVFAAICVFQMFQMYEAARLVPRSADAEAPAAGTASDALSKAGDAISDTFSSLRDNIQDAIKSAPSLDDVSSSLKKFGEDVSSRVQSLTKKVSSSINPGAASAAPST